MWVPSFLFVVEPQKSRFLATLGMTFVSRQRDSGGRTRTGCVEVRYKVARFLGRARGDFGAMVFAAWFGFVGSCDWLRSSIGWSGTGCAAEDEHGRAGCGES